MDGEGDLDVLSASSGNSKIAWYENNGSGLFGSQQVITTGAVGAACVYAADLDGDGDVDVLSASLYDRNIAWYTNDGSGHFGPQQVIATGAGGAACVYAADLDGDGDLDVLLSTLAEDYFDAGKNAWCANDGSGHFAPQQEIDTTGGSSVCATDLDGDGDLDVLLAFNAMQLPVGWISWYANDGSGHFGSPQGIPTEPIAAPYSVYAADLDSDGDLDVLSGSSHGPMPWYANDGSGHFGSPQVVTIEAASACSVYAADLDGDGDLDVLSASYGTFPLYDDNKIAWYANDGSGHFGPQQVISTEAKGPNCVYAADLDGDGDMDVLSASWDDDKIAWYENE